MPGLGKGRRGHHAMTERLDIALTVLCLAGFCATLLAMVVRIAAPFVTERARGAAKRIGGGGLVMLAFACAAILYGGSKPSQTEKSQAEAVPDTVSTANAVASPALPVSRVYPLTTSSASLTIDEQTAAHPFVGEPALVGKWWRRGAYEDGEVVEIPASAGWCFPWRGGHLTRFEIWANGAVYASERDVEPVVRLRTPLSLKPMSSRVVHGFTTNGAYRIEWLKMLSFPIDGMAVSAEVDDVALVCEYIDADGKVASAVSNRLTVVSPKRVAVNGDAVQDVAVLLGSSLSMEVVAEPSASVIPSVSWCDAKLLADRTYTDWRNWRTYGRKVSRTMGESGVFAIKARAQFPGPQWTDVKYVWTEDEDQTIGFRRAGDVNHVGVASTQAQLDLRAAARARLGDTDYAFEVMLPARNGFSGLKKNSWKCNAFVADVAISAGLNVPIQHRTGVALIYERCYPPVANEWANGTVKIDGWQFLGNDVCPEPGLVIGHPAPSGPGHVGIVDFDGEGIAAGEFKVTRQYKAFLDGTSGFNRYVGTQEGGQDE